MLPGSFLAQSLLQVWREENLPKPFRRNLEIPRTQNQHLRLAPYQFLKLRLLPATPRVDATASGQQRELRGLCTTSLHPNTGNPAAQNSSEWTRNMNYPNQAEVVNRFIIFIYLIPRPKTTYDLGAQDTNTLSYPLYILQVSFRRREANSKHQINVNEEAFLTENSRDIKHWKSGPAGNTAAWALQVL